MILTVIGNQKTLHRQIQCQFQGKRHIPFTATAQEKKHGRDTIWEMRALAEGFRKEVGSSESHQSEPARHQLDHRDDQHHRDPQRASGAKGPLLPHQPADQARSPATTYPPALATLKRVALAAGYALHEVGHRYANRSTTRFSSELASNRSTGLSPDADHATPVLIGLLEVGWLSFGVAAPQVVAGENLGASRCPHRPTSLTPIGQGA